MPLHTSEVLLHPPRSVHKVIRGEPASPYTEDSLFTDRTQSIGKFIARR
jgi:hypothetical protein